MSATPLNELAAKWREEGAELHRRSREAMPNSQTALFRRAEERINCAAELEAALAEQWQPIESVEMWAISDNGEFNEDIMSIDSLAATPELAWRKFCYPALNRPAYEADGYRPIKVVMQIYPAPTPPKP